MTHTKDGATTATRAVEDWRSGRAYIDDNGNYHIKPEGRSSGPIAPWNKAAKRTFSDVTALHQAAFPEDVDTQV